jgi:hypothetical protein
MPTLLKTKKIAVTSFQREVTMPNPSAMVGRATQTRDSTPAFEIASTDVLFPGHFRFLADYLNCYEHAHPA